MHTDIVIVGAGYAGVIAANRLAAGRRPAGTTITLVNPVDVFVHRVRLHETLASGLATSAPLARLLHPDVRVVLDRVERIRPARSELELASGRTLPYDRLLVTSGSVPLTVPGAASTGTAQGTRTARALVRTDRSSPVTVLGAGLTGIETAAELAVSGRRVRLVTTDVVGPAMPERARAAIRDDLRRLGVEVEEYARPAAPDHRAAGPLLACTGFRAASLATSSGLDVDDLGRLRVDATLRSPAHPRILAAGDAAAIAGVPLRMSCANGVPLGVHAAGVLLADLRDEAPRPYVPWEAPWCIGTGGGRAVVARPTRGDRPGVLFASGRTAGLVKAGIVRAVPVALRAAGLGGRAPERSAADRALVAETSPA